MAEELHKKGWKTVKKSVKPFSVRQPQKQGKGDLYENLLHVIHLCTWKTYYFDTPVIVACPSLVFTSVGYFKGVFCTKGKKMQSIYLFISRLENTGISKLHGNS